MENKIYEVTIPLEYFEHLISTEIKLDNIIDAFIDEIEKASLSWDNEKLDVPDYIKKYCRNEYNNRLNKLKEKKENE